MPTVGGPNLSHLPAPLVLGAGSPKTFSNLSAMLDDVGLWGDLPLATGAAAAGGTGCCWGDAEGGPALNRCCWDFWSLKKKKKATQRTLERSRFMEIELVLLLKLLEFDIYPKYPRKL